MPPSLGLTESTLYPLLKRLEGASCIAVRSAEHTNFEPVSGYGTDRFCASAAERIRAACDDPAADVFFLVGGTQTNAVVISSLLAGYEGVIAADTGHIAVHEPSKYSGIS